MAYNGWRLTEEARNALLVRFPPRYPDVIAHHVTLKRGKQIVPVPATVEVVGYADDGVGVEALVVSVNGSTERADGKTFHITWSIDREAGYKPVSSNDAVQNGWSEIEAQGVAVTPFYVDHDKAEHTEESIAKQRCRDEGYEDVDFVGTKGYPNWHDFTDAAIARTRAFVAETQKLFTPGG